MVEVGQIGDLIVGNIKHPKMGVLLKPRDFGKNIVRDVEFLEVGETR